MKTMLYLVVVSVLAASLGGCNWFKAGDANKDELTALDMIELVQAVTETDKNNMKKFEELKDAYVKENPVNNINFGTSIYQFAMDGYSLESLELFKIKQHHVDAADTLASILKKENEVSSLTIYPDIVFHLSEDEKAEDHPNDVVIKVNKKWYFIRDENVYIINAEDEASSPKIIGTTADRTIHSKNINANWTKEDYISVSVLSTELPALDAVNVQTATAALADYLFKDGVDVNQIALLGISDVDAQKAYVYHVEVKKGHSVLYAVRGDKKLYQYTYTPSLLEVDVPDVPAPQRKESSEFFIDLDHVGMMDSYEHFDLVYVAPKLKLTGKMNPETGAEALYVKALKSFDDKDNYTYKEIFKFSNGTTSYSLRLQNPKNKYSVFFNAVDKIDGQEVLVYNVDKGWGNYAVTHDQKVYAYEGAFAPVGVLPDKYPELVSKAEVVKAYRENASSQPDKYLKTGDNYSYESLLAMIDTYPEVGGYLYFYLEHQLKPMDDALCKMTKLKDEPRCHFTTDDKNALANLRAAANHLIKQTYTGVYDASSWVLLADKKDTIDGKNVIKFTVGQGISDPDAQYALIASFIYQKRFEGAVSGAGEVFYYKDGKPEFITTLK